MRNRLGMGVLAGMLVIFAADPVSAFCRTSTCGTSVEGGCELDPAGCLVGGKPLAWPRACVWFSVHDAGSPKLGIAYEEAMDAVIRAFDAWTSVNCGGGSPSLLVRATDAPALCGRPEHNPEAANANVWMFQNESWRYARNALAVTTVTFDDDTGAILDADVELNALAELTLNGAEKTYDLMGVIQHEAGHFLGISHSTVPEATMWRSILRGDLKARTLHADDAQAVCSAYPPERPHAVCNFEPPNSWAAECQSESGCSIAPATTARPTRRSNSSFAMLIAISILLRRATTRQRRIASS